MALNKIDGGHFSAIAASFNLTVKRDGREAARPLPQRWSCRKTQNYENRPM